MSELFQARCPKCNRRLCDCEEGNRIKAVCPRCRNVMVDGRIINGRFVAKTTRIKDKPPKRKTAVGNPPMLTG